MYIFDSKKSELILKLEGSDEKNALFTRINSIRFSLVDLRPGF